MHSDPRHWSCQEHSASADLNIYMEHHTIETLAINLAHILKIVVNLENLDTCELKHIHLSAVCVWPRVWWCWMGVIAMTPVLTLYPRIDQQPVSGIVLIYTPLIRCHHCTVLCCTVLYCIVLIYSPSSDVTTIASHHHLPSITSCTYLSFSATFMELKSNLSIIQCRWESSHLASENIG